MKKFNAKDCLKKKFLFQIETKYFNSKSSKIMKFGYQNSTKLVVKQKKQGEIKK